MFPLKENEDQSFCCIWCIPYRIGMQIICFMNIALSGFFLFLQVPQLTELTSGNGFMSNEKPSFNLIVLMSVMQIGCIALSLVWFKNPDVLKNRQLLILVQVLYVICNLLLALFIDKGGLGAVVFDSLFLIPAVKYANFLK